MLELALRGCWITSSCSLVASKALGEHISLSTLQNSAHSLLIILGLIGRSMQEEQPLCKFPECVKPPHFSRSLVLHLTSVSTITIFFFMGPWLSTRSSMSPAVVGHLLGMAKCIVSVSLSTRAKGAAEQRNFLAHSNVVQIVILITKHHSTIN